MEKVASSSRFVAATIGVLGFLAASYFATPIMYQIPLEIALRQGVMSYDTFFGFFQPIRSVAERAPAYNRWTTGQYVLGVERDLVVYEAY